MRTIENGSGEARVGGVRRRGTLAGSAVTLMLVGVLAGMLAGCSGGGEPEATVERVDEERTETTQSPGGAVAEDDSVAAWFEGGWTVDFVLTSVTPDAGWSRQAAGQPNATWTCETASGEMTIDNGMHVYDGTLTEDGDAWRYEGSATYADEQGTMWTSVISVEGNRLDEDSFSAEQWGEISSDSDGVLYTATWDADGTRIP